MVAKYQIIFMKSCFEQLLPPGGWTRQPSWSQISSRQWHSNVWQRGSRRLATWQRRFHLFLAPPKFLNHLESRHMCRRRRRRRGGKTSVENKRAWATSLKKFPSSEVFFFKSCHKTLKNELRGFPRFDPARGCRVVQGSQEGDHRDGDGEQLCLTL